MAGEIDIELGEERFHIRLAWVLADNAPALLGRLDLFGQADVCFRERANTITLSPPATEAP